MLFSEIIKKKVSNHALSASEIHTFVDGLADNKVPPEQISALCMAILFNGMDAQETGCEAGRKAGNEGVEKNGRRRKVIRLFRAAIIR